MFKELVPILRSRAVLMTATALDDDQIRVNVVPKKMKDGDHDALTTPLSVTGTAEELDAQLADHPGWLCGVASSDEECSRKGKDRDGRSHQGCAGRGARQGEDADRQGTGESRISSDRCHRSATRASEICSNQARFALRRTRAGRG